MFLSWFGKKYCRYYKLYFYLKILLFMLKLWEKEGRSGGSGEFGGFRD